jgi:hypothetical protein
MTDVATKIVALPEAGFLTPGDIYDKGLAFIQNARQVAADGLSWSEFSELTSSLMKLATKTLDTVQRMSNEEKKAAVMDLVGRLFDAVAGYAAPVWLYPVWPIAKPILRALVIAFAGGTMEQILELVRKDPAA